MTEKRFQGMKYVNYPSADFIPIVCGHCGRSISGHVIALYGRDLPAIVTWVICPICSHGSVLDYDGITYPPPKFGDSLQGLPTEVAQAYEEARNCMSVKAFSSCTLICRKILMHVAVDKGDTAGKKFAEYIDYLRSGGYTTSVMNDWVEKIREGGNESTHEIPSASEEKAKNVLLFTIQLLRNVYEMKFIADNQMGVSSSSNA